ncbi:hypothetical protein E4O03_00695 [Treponema sp. OMZ 792]|uniref:hypothetical protein n=1 Tax=unclassified Treponema TaxID=2638727 RepID=UPI0020A5B77C|nr:MULTISPECIES: hypothetical protein [unclassified Treponema]UTC75282.1 hypothetical protein E4O03_00695 [Treponema sp. OMZ 792]UTC79287.1 hypothetical protein E4O07_00705 [Treponema sp. OMZ 798]
MKDLLNNGFQIVSETEMLMVEGGTGDNGPQKGKDPLYILDGDGEYTPPPPPSNGGGCGDVNWVEMR